MRWVVAFLVIAFCCDARYIPEDGVYSVVDNMPTYKLGMDSLNNYIQYHVQQSGYENDGSVLVSFIVLQDGNLDSLKVIRGLDGHLDSFAMELLKNTPVNWNPGVTEENPVSVRVVYPINF